MSSVSPQCTLEGEGLEELDARLSALFTLLDTEDAGSITLEQLQDGLLMFRFRPQIQLTHADCQVLRSGIPEGSGFRLTG